MGVLMLNKSSRSFLSSGSQKAINEPTLLYLTAGETEGALDNDLAFSDHPRPLSNLSTLSDPTALTA